MHELSVCLFPLYWQVIELLMTCTLYLIVATSLLSDSLSRMAVPRSVCSLVSLMFLLPCLLLTDLRPVSTLSLLCSLAHILIRWFNRSGTTFRVLNVHKLSSDQLTEFTKLYSIQATWSFYNPLLSSFLPSFSRCCWLCCLLPYAAHCSAGCLICLSDQVTCIRQQNSSLFQISKSICKEALYIRLFLKNMEQYTNSINKSHNEIAVISHLSHVTLNLGTCFWIHG